MLHCATPNKVASSFHSAIFVKEVGKRASCDGRRNTQVGGFFVLPICVGIIFQISLWKTTSRRVPFQAVFMQYTTDLRETNCFTRHKDEFLDPQQIHMASQQLMLMRF